jgi:glycine/D-amino acid oxidase-like deaminating enzyme
MGGGPVGLGFGSDMDRDRSPAAWSHLERHIGEVFPALRGIRVEHRWGGPFSVTTDLTPALGYLGDERCVYSLGCVGHGVSASHLNGQTIRDLVLGRDSELTRAPFVNRRVVPWPPEPLRLAISAALRGYLAAEDRWHERGA